MTLALGLALLSISQPQPATSTGTIGGFVVNASRADSPAAGADVFLQARIVGQFVVVARAKADPEGRFLFEGLPTDRELLFLPGAALDDIHYPGPRITLNPANPAAQVIIKVREVITAPSPLVIDDCYILVETEPGALRVTETLQIENPEADTYVGTPPPGSPEPVTLQLRIPPDFERVTFHEEFFGRQFAIINGTLATGLPWTPGRRELKYTYVIRNEAVARLWERPLDLPCRKLTLTVRAENRNSLSCNLDPAPQSVVGESSFTSSAELPAGFSVSLSFKRLQVPLITYARWAVLIALATLIAGTWAVMARRRTSPRQAASTTIARARTRKRRVPS